MEFRGQGSLMGSLGLCTAGQATPYSRPDLAHTMLLASLQGAISRAGAALTLHEVQWSSRWCAALTGPARSLSASQALMGNNRAEPAKTVGNSH